MITNYTSLPNLAVLMQGIVTTGKKVAICPEEEADNLLTVIPYLNRLGAEVRSFENIDAVLSHNKETEQPEILLLSSQKVQAVCEQWEAKPLIIQAFLEKPDADALAERRESLFITIHSIPLRKDTYLLTNHASSVTRALKGLDEYSTIKVESLK